MMAVCHFLLNHPFKATYIKILKVYFFIFTFLTVSISGYTVYQTQDHWYQPLSSWLDEQKNIIYALAADQETAEPIPVQPEPVQISIKEEVRLKVPLIGQYPELPRGCEVTSLAMLLQYHKIEANKMQLAEEIKKDPAPFQIIEGVIHFGNPATGFVGDMYSLSKPGYGVYHGPVAALAKQYAGDKVQDFSGESFDEIISQLSKERPVWVIINTTYEELPGKAFTKWQTAAGEISITRKEHAVVITGYDEKYIYFNDPLKKRTKAPINSFREAWVQMGKQAITIVQS